MPRFGGLRQHAIMHSAEKRPDSAASLINLADASVWVTTIMNSLQHLLDNNRRWSAERTRQDPEFFSRLAHQQKPQYLWIGCADSRVPANVIIGLDPGQVFVHRNIANLVVHTDMNCLSVLQYAVDVLQVKHVIICGHYGCGGVMAAMSDQPHGLIDNWLRHIKDVYYDHTAELEAIADSRTRADRLSEINVAQQVANVCYTTIVQGAWQRGQPLAVHGWIYGLHDGRINDLGATIEGPEQIRSLYRMALRGVPH
jgi:carbonic anhydrase